LGHPNVDVERGQGRARQTEGEREYARKGRKVRRIGKPECPKLKGKVTKAEESSVDHGCQKNSGFGGKGGRYLT